MDFKVNIFYEFKEGAWGGGNQFLKALRNYFKDFGIYTESPADADVILVNSHHGLDKVFIHKWRHPNQILIHRVDGPISDVRKRDKIIDEQIIQFNAIVDGTIFQSNWSKEKNYEIGMQKSPYETTIINAPDSTIFNSKNEMLVAKRKIKLIATSWSPNIRKGFDIYKFLDEHLDFDKYEMTFVGNSPIQFKNITWLKPVSSDELAKILKGHDIFITASRSDPCSNSLIEALHCGLPAVARNDGGHPEIVGKAGELFENKEEIVEAIEKVATNYEFYQFQINLPTLDEVGEKYYEFAQRIYDDYLDGNYSPKIIKSIDYIKLIEIKMKGLILHVYHAILN